MQLEALFKGIETSSEIRDIEISGLANYLKEVRKGSIFFCASNHRMELRALLAVLLGARTVVTERRLHLPIPQIVVGNVLGAMRTCCANYLSAMHKQLKVVAVTGTNGKTSTTYMTKALLEANGIKTGLIGTVECLAGDEKLGATITTPQPERMVQLFSHMIETGCKAIVMEASSEGLAEDRLSGIQFDVGIFTNLTQDHLDYHGTMENYASAKRKLFAQCRTAVFNADSEYSSYMAENFHGTMMTYGVHHPAEIQACDIRYQADRTDYTLCLGGKSYPVEITVPGAFNVYNSLASASACFMLGMEPEKIAAGMRNIHTVPGRIEHIPAPGQPFSVILDYAHTPDGLENILRAVREITSGKIITVFGCGGKRDKTKRPVMGYTAGQLSDYCFVTSDNPRNEKPMDIIQDILPGIEKSGCPFEVEENRVLAIEKALRHAGSGDTVVLAGKGHEQFQEIQGVKHPFDERAIVREALEKMKNVGS